MTEKEKDKFEARIRKEFGVHKCADVLVDIMNDMYIEIHKLNVIDDKLIKSMGMKNVRYRSHKSQVCGISGRIANGRTCECELNEAKTSEK